MMEILNGIIPYISGFYTLPWILVGFLVTIGLSKKFGEQKINGVMKKIGSVILFFYDSDMKKPLFFFSTTS